MEGGLVRITYLSLTEDGANTQQTTIWTLIEVPHSTIALPIYKLEMVELAVRAITAERQNFESVTNWLSESEEVR
jgi:hypothetical protein